MKIKKQYILIGSISILILIAGFSYLKYDPSQSPLSRGELQIVPKTLSVKNIKVSLFVLDKKYEGEFKEGSSVFEVMRKIKEESNPQNLFDFKYTKHAGLGIFIDEINGKIGGEGGYWIYSVNGKEASVGISNYKVNNGDQISWKYEK